MYIIINNWLDNQFNIKYQTNNGTIYTSYRETSSINQFFISQVKYDSHWQVM